MTFILFVCLLPFLYLFTLFLAFRLSKKMGKEGGGGGFQEIGMVFLFRPLSELSIQVDQFLLLSVGTLRQCGYLIATTHLIPLSRITKLRTCQFEENDKIFNML